jgi:hypothetical protein
MYFWNNGGLAIRKEDIPENKPLSILYSGTGSILDASIVNVSNVDNNLLLSPTKSEKEVNILFDFLGPSEGAQFKILLAGNDIDNLSVSGQCIDSERLKEVPIQNPVPKSAKAFLILTILLCPVILFLLMYLVIDHEAFLSGRIFIDLLADESGRGPVSIAGILFGMIVFGVYFFVLLKRSFSKYSIPWSLKKVKEKPRNFKDSLSNFLKTEI